MHLKDIIAKIEAVLFHPLGVQKTEAEALAVELKDHVDAIITHDATELTKVRDDLKAELAKVESAV